MESGIVVEINGWWKISTRDAVFEYRGDDVFRTPIIDGAEYMDLDPDLRKDYFITDIGEALRSAYDAGEDNIFQVYLDEETEDY